MMPLKSSADSTAGLRDTIGQWLDGHSDGAQVLAASIFRKKHAQDSSYWPVIFETTFRRR
jgi:hypothetical protein